MNVTLSRAIEECRVCHSRNLENILTLGELYVSDFFVDSDKHLAGKAPLELVLCNASNGGCGLLQLRHTVNPELLYRTYWYRSGTNITMVEELTAITARIQEMVPLRSGDYVIDIGANDGTLLRSYDIAGLRTIGFEPSKNLAVYNAVGTTQIISNFFSYALWNTALPSAKAKVITAIAMFYDLDDPNAFVTDVERCLDDEGIFIIQMSYLPTMLEKNNFDNICHEHLEYYSLLSLEQLLHRHGLKVCDVELNEVNGGSYRVYIRKNGWRAADGNARQAQKHVEELRQYETSLSLNQRDVYDQFAARIENIKKQVKEFIENEHQRGKKIYVYGASTKGNTLLQYFGIDHRYIIAAAERNPDKWGLKTVGTGIPIISEERARTEKPDYFLILPWHFLHDFIDREREYLASGGKFIVPLPEFRIIDSASASPL